MKPEVQGQRFRIRQKKWIAVGEGEHRPTSEIFRFRVQLEVLRIDRKQQVAPYLDVLRRKALRDWFHLHHVLALHLMFRAENPAKSPPRPVHRRTCQWLQELNSRADWPEDLLHSSREDI
jgi:hypothetical protein